MGGSISEWRSQGRFEAGSEGNIRQEKEYEESCVAVPVTRTSMYAMDSRSSLLLCSMPKWLLMLREKEEWGGRDTRRRRKRGRKVKVEEMRDGTLCQSNNVDLHGNTCSEAHMVVCCVCWSA